MSDGSRSEDSTFDSDTFEEWVENTAESKGISRGEVLDQMLSSYWILEELTGMMDEAGEDGPATRGVSDASDPEPEGGGSPDAADRDAGSGDPDGSSDGQDPSELIRELRDLRSAILDMPERNRGQSQSRSQPQRRPESDWGPRWDDRPQWSAPPRTDSRLRETLSELEDSFEDLSTELEDLQSRHDRDVDQLESDVENTLETLGELESAVDDLVDQSDLEALAVSLDEDLAQVQEATTELRGRVAQVEDSHSEVTEELSALRQSHNEQDERLEREFDSIENLFQHLLDKTEDLEYRLGAVAESHREDLDPVEEHIEQREEFESLMREAHGKGVSRAVCDNCDETVDLGVLQDARCPNCDRTYTGIQEGGWLPFSKATLETEPIRSASGSVADGPPAPPAEDQSAEDRRRGPQ